MKFPKILHQVVGEGIVVVDDQQFHEWARQDKAVQLVRVVLLTGSFFEA